MKIASFNIQKFGRNKASDPNIIRILAKIVSRYDIILILEVVDNSGTSIKTLLEALNKANRKHHYSLQISSRLGRSRYKEQFMFLYRDDLVNLVGSYQFEDSKTLNQDVFARDPYILRFRCPTTELQDLVLMPVHTTPEESDIELDKLYDVFTDVKEKWKTDNVMILGDFNADGSYLSKKEMKTIRIRSDKNFHWLISDDQDTTASNKNSNTYDRIVVYGDDMLKAVVPGSAKPFNFQKAYRLSDELALDVSDHYPVEVTLKSKVPDDEDEELDEAQLLRALVSAVAPVAPVDEEVLALQKGNLLLEREKLGLEIQMLKMQMEKLKSGF
ncbi:deoxyribonuclease-1-like isoform X1 [Eucyclogobius newberryi]|uniref:deoxyribonuclease-1-like isoform X1 n=1 Tax=Eucyclogobius newberryi TaxID=166745 RepID=UPI003B5A2866